MYACLYCVRTCMCVRVHVCVCACVYVANVSLYLCMCACVFACSYVCMYLSMHACKEKGTYQHKSMHVRICACISIVRMFACLKKETKTSRKKHTCAHTVEKCSERISVCTYTQCIYSHVHAVREETWHTAEVQENAFKLDVVDAATTIPVGILESGSKLLWRHFDP